MTVLPYNTQCPQRICLQRLSYPDNIVLPDEIEYTTQPLLGTADYTWQSKQEHYIEAFFPPVRFNFGQGVREL